MVIYLSELPKEEKLIIVIWSFKRKQSPDGMLLKYKARLCTHSRQQMWGENYWKTFSSVVN